MDRRRAERPSLHERIHGEPPAVPAEAQRAAVKPPPIRPCWVTDEHGRLLEWRQTVSGWQGRVVRPALEDGHWFVVEEWLPARMLGAASSPDSYAAGDARLLR
jgi:hypothetical protein